MAQAGKVPVEKSLFGDNTILKADVAGTPLALSVPVSRLLGRAAVGGIEALTAVEALTLLDAVARSLFGANTILKADVDNTPVALTVAASRIVGRAAAGEITALTPAEVSTLLSLSNYVLKSLFDANTILAANADNTPLALAIAASRIVGRGAAGNIAALTGAQIMAILTGQAGADFSMNTHKITSVTDPGANQDAATKKYVDDNMAAPNTAMASAYSTDNNRVFEHGRVARIELDTEVYNPGSNFNNAVWYDEVQADADSDATHIEDDDGAFSSDLLYALVTWASDSPPTANIGYGYVTGVDADTLTINKASGNDFGASYYYVINHSEYTAPVAGYYHLDMAVAYLNASVIANKSYDLLVYINNVWSGGSPIHSAGTGRICPSLSRDVHLAALDVVKYCAYHLALANVPQEGSPRTMFDAHLIQAD